MKDKLVYTYEEALEEEKELERKKKTVGLFIAIGKEEI